MRDDDIGGAIRWRLHLPASPETVYEMLDSDRGRASFWATSASEADGRIHFEFPNGVITESRIVERDPPSRFAIEYFGGVARFELTTDGLGGTDLLFVHEDVDGADWIEGPSERRRPVLRRARRSGRDVSPRNLDSAAIRRILMSYIDGDSDIDGDSGDPEISTASF